MTECSECDRRASAFWGLHAYCSSCIVDAQRADPQMAQQAQDARVAGLCKGLGDSKRVAQ